MGVEPIAELHPDDVETVLHRHHVGRLACVVDGAPYVVPVTYAYAGDALYFRTAPGRKLEALRAEPRACFEVDERWDDATWRSVVVEGTVEEVADEPSRQAALALLAGAMPDGTRSAPDAVVLRRRPTTKTGRAARRAPPPTPRDDPAPPLRGLDLRAGDERNFPRGERTSGGRREGA